MSDSGDVLSESNKKFRACYKGKALTVIPQSVAISVVLSLDNLILKFFLGADSSRPLAKIVMNASMNLKLYVATTIE